MKKLLFTILISLLFIPMVFAEDLVKIEKIEMESKSVNTIVNANPTFEGLNMNYDVTFKAKDDFVKYKITIKNNTNKEYKIKEETLFGDSDYIKYTYDVPGTLKSNNTIEIYLTISYEKELDEKEFTDGKYTEKKDATIKLFDEEGKAVNPNTKSSTIMFIMLGIAVSLLSLSIVLLIKERNSRYVTVAMFISIMLIPFVVKAIEELVLKTSVNVEIVKAYQAVYQYDKDVVLTEEERNNAEEGMYFDCSTFIISDDQGESPVKYVCSIYENYVDPVLHVAGEEVVVPTINTENAYLYNSDVCVYQGDSHYICSDNPLIKDIIVDDLGYFQSMNGERTEDYNTMNPRCKEGNECYISNQWNDSHHYFAVEHGVRYTMPAHDVIFTTYKMK